MSDINSTYFEDPRFNGRQGFGASLADYLVAFGRRRREVFGLGSAGQRGKAAILDRLADHVSELDELRDRRLMILGAVNSAFAQLRRSQLVGDMGSIEPGEVGVSADRFDKPSYLQGWLLEVLGDPGHPAPTPDQTITDLAAAGVRDLAERFVDVTATARGKNKELVAEIDSLTGQLEQARIEANEVDALRSANEEFEAELAAKERLIAEQQGALVALEPKKAPRRRNIEPAIYRTSSGGLEVAKPGGGYVKADSLGAARLLRDELRSDGEDSDPDDATDPLEAALDARETEVGRELTEEEIGAIEAEISTPTPSGRGEA